MKVLSMVWTIYDNTIETFANNYTGLGVLVKNLCEYIGREAESYLFIGKCYLPEQKLGNITIVGTDFRLDQDDTDAVRDAMFVKNMTIKFGMAIENIKPDIVNFHGIGEVMQQCIHICIKEGIPFVYTEHLYIGCQSAVQYYDKDIAWEKKLYQMPVLPIIAVSQEMKRKILRDFPDISETNIQVIANGTNFISEYIESDYKEKYHLKGKKILLCVGTLLQRKNQMMLVEVCKKLPLEIKNSLRIIFCGKDAMNGRFQNKITQEHLEKELLYIGAVGREEMKKLYSIADGLIIPSLAEGFSIAALEAITYGLPLIMFEDLEGADELNDREVVCFAEERSEKALVNAIVMWYRKTWDREYIVRFSKKFTMERMAKNYLDYYKLRIRESTRS